MSGLRKDIDTVSRLSITTDSNGYAVKVYHLRIELHEQNGKQAHQHGKKAEEWYQKMS